MIVSLLSRAQTAGRRGVFGPSLCYKARHLAHLLATLLVGALALALQHPAGADDLMLVQAGAFWMGRDDGPAEDGPLHRVWVRDFWIESSYRVEDLLGNLREWTSTTLRAYPYRADDGREPFTGTGRVVVRGASHDDPVEALHVAGRHSYDRRGAAAGHHHVGFRCATSQDLGGD